MILLGTHADRQGLITVAKNDLLHHTAVIGQSGSGKSYFLARLLEEITLRTRARILILDPNGDFSHFHLPQETAYWNAAEFETLRAVLHSGQNASIADYESHQAFTDIWSQRTFQLVLAGRRFRTTLREGAYEAPLMLHWKWLDREQDFLLKLDPIEYSNVYQGVQTCIKYAEFHSADFPQGYSLEDLEAIAQQFGSKLLPIGEWPEALTLEDNDWLAVRVHFRQLRKRFYRLWYRGELKGRTAVPNDLSNYIYNGFRWNSWQVCIAGLAGLDVDHMQLAADAALYRVWASALVAWHIARNRQTTELKDRTLAEIGRTSSTTEVHAEPEEMAPPATEAVEDGWSDNRVPTFIVIDEAHNFAPQEPVNELQSRVSDKIATIAAEGRKYGLFLVLSTQRPQKLRRGLLSECENSAVLRIQSKLERAHASEALGIPTETMEHVSTYPLGVALMHGRWVPAPLTTKFAPARTILGGGGLDKQYWQIP